MKPRMRTRFFVLNFLWIVFFLSLAQGKTYAWFHAGDNYERCPIFESPQNERHVSKAYAFLPNIPDADSEIRLFKPSSKNSIPTSAGELKIDIPFNLLSTSITNVQALIDRQVAADLKLKNLIKQYLAQQKKNAEMLKDLDIPYLDAKATSPKDLPTSEVEKIPSTEALKKKIEEEVLFQAAGKGQAGPQDNPAFQPIITGEKGKKNSVSDLEKYERLSIDGDYSKNQNGISPYHETYGRDTELPWIFSFGLKLLRSLADNKIEIFSWAVVMAVIGLVGTIVVKR